MDGHDMPSKAFETKLTYEDFLSFPDDGLRHELIDGEHYVTPSPTTRHQQLSKRLFRALDRYLEETQAGQIFYAPFDVVLSPFDVVEPDLLVILRDQSEILTDKHVRGAPALVIEILSPGTRRIDEGVKYRLYDRTGVREYWVVDPDAERVTIHRRGSDGCLSEPAELRRERQDSLTSPLVPGFILPLLELFK